MSNLIEDSKGKSVKIVITEKNPLRVKNQNFRNYHRMIRKISGKNLIIIEVFKYYGNLVGDYFTFLVKDEDNNEYRVSGNNITILK